MSNIEKRPIRRLIKILADPRARRLLYSIQDFENASKRIKTVEAEYKTAADKFVTALKTFEPQFAEKTGEDVPLFHLVSRDHDMILHISAIREKDHSTQVTSTSLIRVNPNSEPSTWNSSASSTVINLSPLGEITGIQQAQKFIPWAETFEPLSSLPLNPQP